MKPLVPLEDRDYAIYLITNTVNGKVYVGQTCKTVEERWDLHCWNASTGSKGYFASAIRKHGPETFRIVVLETVHGRTAADETERFYISLFESMDRTKGYNCTSGGDGGFVFSTESREKMSRSQKALGRKMPPDIKERLRQIAATRDRPRSEREKQSKSLRKLPTEEIHRLYLEEGKNTYEIAEVLNTTQSSIWNILKFDGVPRRPNKGETLPQFRKDICEKEITRLYVEERLSTVEIAERFNTSPTTISCRLRTAGVIMRSRREALINAKSQRWVGKKVASFSIKKLHRHGSKRYWLGVCGECGYQQYFTSNQLSSGKIGSCEWHTKHPVPLRFCSAPDEQAA